MGTFSNIAPALCQTFSILLLGYVLARVGVVSSALAGSLGSYVGNIALPALLFLTMATLDLGSINWDFFFSILIAKAFVFLLVLTLSYLMLKRTQGSQRAGAMASVYAMFCTAGNEIALGLPIMTAIYDESHPTYTTFVFIVAPVNLVCLNPIAFLLLERYKSHVASSVSEADRDTPLLGCEEEQGSPSTDSKVDVNPVSKSKEEQPEPLKGSPLARIAVNVITNPIVLMTVLGVAYNLALGTTVPAALKLPLQTLGNSFAATALFSLGVGIVRGNSPAADSSQQQQDRNKSLLSALLILGKSILLPVVARQTAVALSHSEDLATAAFLVGMFPTAAFVPIVAQQYGVEASSVRSALVLGTAISAPLMLVSTQLAMVNDQPDLEDKLFEATNTVGIVSCFALLWLFTVLYLHSRNRRRRGTSPAAHSSRIMLHMVYLAAGFMFLFALTSQLCRVDALMRSNAGTQIRFFVSFFGIVSSRVWASCLVAGYAILRYRGPSMLVRLRGVLYAAGFGVPLVSAAIIPLVADAVTVDSLNTYQRCWFLYGRPELISVTIVLLLSLVTSTVALLYSRCRSTSFVLPVPTVTPEIDAAHGKDVSAVNGYGSAASLMDLPTPRAVFTSYSDSVPSTLDFVQDHVSRTVQHGGGQRLHAGVAASWPRSGIADESRSQTSEMVPQVWEALPVGDNSHAGLREYQSNNSEVATGDNHNSDNGGTASHLSSVYTSNFSASDGQPFLRLTLFTVYEIVSMALGALLGIWNLSLNQDDTSGLEVELRYLDGVLTWGQGLMFAVVFATDSKSMKVLRKEFQRLYAKWRAVVAQADGPMI